MNPATMYITNETAATVITYGNCVETWFTWLHCTPALAIIVVSEIGEQWSPQTAPPIHAEIEMILKGSPTWKTAMQIGIKIPNVPQDVPVAKAKPAAIIKIIAGKNIFNAPALPSTTPATYPAAPPQTIRHRFKSPSKRQNQNRWNHRLKTFDDTRHTIREPKNFSNAKNNQRKKHRRLQLQ